MSNKLYVFGHTNPDTDSIMSSIVFANLQRALGYDATAYKLGDVNKETKYACNNKNRSSKEVANELLSKINNINDLKNIDYNTLKSINGIGCVKAIDILACIELGSRINKTIISINNIKFNNPSTIFEYYKDSLGYIKQEKFICIYEKMW